MKKGGDGGGLIDKVVNTLTIRKPGNYNLASFILLKNYL